MAAEQEILMIVRQALHFDYLVEWLHYPQGSAGDSRHGVKPSRPWTHCTIYRIEKGEKKHPSNGLRAPGHFGMVWADANLHPEDRYRYVEGEKVSLERALEIGFASMTEKSTKGLPMSVAQSILQPHFLDKAERAVFWENFTRKRLKLHKRNGAPGG